MHQKLIRILALLFLIANSMVGEAQPGVTFDLPKPKKFENRRLGSEKTGEKKFTVPRRFMQNTITHYNYFFNANEKIREVLERAKADHRDNYSQLLSFYNYNFEETGRYKIELDSVIYKATAGILLHDLRNSWVDNLYLLIGQAYYFKKDFDSAYLTFQYLNYAFSPKEKDGYDKVIGSNSNEGGSAFSISTSEKRNVIQKALTRPPSRNESLLWQIKTYLANSELVEAAVLIQTLKFDPLFPSRLKTDLEEVQAWYFYRQTFYDSAAIHLQLALTNARNQQEKARWEYLIAQLFEKSGRKDQAREFYEKASKLTIDPVLEVYALLNSIRQNNSNEAKVMQDAINELGKMGRKDKYLNYRDLIYYTAAQMELDRKNTEGAINFLSKSIKYNTNNPTQKNKSFLALAEISFSQKEFINANRYYDSVDINSIEPSDQEVIRGRKSALAAISLQLGIILRQDSLQRLAAMAPSDREAYIRKLIKKIRKQQGLKEEEVSFGNTAVFGNTNAPADLFGQSSDKGDWYFTNVSLKSKGYADFKARWGNRPNNDNWRRSAALIQPTPTGKNPVDPRQPLTNTQTESTPEPLTFETLLSNVPTTAEKMKKSNDSIMIARFELGKALQDGLEDYPAAIESYEKLLVDFPHSPNEEQTLFNLYYCYKKTGDTQKMAHIKNLMESSFSGSKLTAIVKNPEASDNLHKKEGEALYNEIYNLFIEGKFEEALTKKRGADTLFGNHFWSPQLLYIEAVYHIHQRDDSTAKNVLGNITTLFPGTPMAAKAKNLIDVLQKRRQIEDYLTKLEVVRPVEDSALQSGQKGDSLHGVVTAKAPQDQPAKPLDNKAVTNQPRGKTDSLQVIKKPVILSAYTNTPDQPHYAVLVMDKVDPVYVSEARNAFNRFNKEKYFNQQIDLTPLALTDEVRFILFGKFENAIAALDYIEKVKKQAATEIIPWMPAGKYSFLMVTEANLEILKNSRDISLYRKFLTQYYPGIF